MNIVDKLKNNNEEEWENLLKYAKENPTFSNLSPRVMSFKKTEVATIVEQLYLKANRSRNRLTDVFLSENMYNALLPVWTNDNSSSKEEEVLDEKKWQKSSTFIHKSPASAGDWSVYGLDNSKDSDQEVLETVLVGEVQD